MTKRLHQLFILLVLLASCQSSTDSNNLIADKNDEANSYTNPILSGFYPDPSIVKVADDYYLTTSSFAYFPGLPIFHSKDLVHWNQIGHVLDRNEQVSLLGQGVSRGLFAPTISYSEGLFYVICTNVGDKGNFVVTSEDPKGPWSDPVWLPEVSGIDPSLFFDDEGKSYIVYNSEPPNNESLYEGHRTIKKVAFDKEKLKVISEPEIIVNGGTDLSKNPIWIEAPHLYKLRDWYYLMCAEGGTSFEHSEVIFRSKSVDGPYVPWDKNPILTQRDLDESRPNPITCTGHADIVEGPDGEWWAVFLGTRPYEGKHFNMGRETFLLPVTWTEDEWPMILNPSETVPYRNPAPQSQEHTVAKIPLNGNYTYRDPFDELHMSWTFLRNPTEKWYSIQDGKLEIGLRPETVEGDGNPSFLSKRQNFQFGSAVTELDFNPMQEGEQAGLIIFQNESHHYFFCKEKINDQSMLSLYKTFGKQKEKIKSIEIESDQAIVLKYEAKASQLDFYYGYTEDDLEVFAQNQDARILSTETAGGFVGVMLGPYATSNGKSTNNKADFDWFEIQVNEPVYQQ